jgi:hypothetical protein
MDRWIEDDSGPVIPGRYNVNDDGYIVEPRPIVRSYDTDPMAKIGRLALPWTTLTMLLTAVGSVLVALWDAGRVVIMVGAGVLLLARWIWQSRAAVVGYSRKQGRTTRR